MPNTLRHRGFTLLEVLIALLIFSLGLLGMAGLLVVSVKTNHSAYLRTQASFLAQSMADRMRANVPRVWTNDYNSGGYPTGDADPCTGGAACSRANIAVRDRAQWSTQLQDLLPNATATINCVPDGTVTVSPAEMAGGAPYTGLCTIMIQWTESSLARDAANPTQVQTFTWKFQP